MSGVLRSGLSRLVAASSSNAAPAGQLLKAGIPALQQAYHISGRSVRASEGRKLPTPYDYKNKDYSYFNALFDKTTHRFDDNSKVRSQLSVEFLF